MRITVERPLRLRWEVTGETLAAVASLADRKLSKLDDATREGLRDGLAEYAGLSGTDREALAVKLAPVFARVRPDPRPGERRVGRARRPRPGGPDHHGQEGRAAARPRVARPRERAAAGEEGSLRGRRGGAAGVRRVPDGDPGLHGEGGPALRPRAPGWTTTRRRSGTRSR